MTTKIIPKAKKEQMLLQELMLDFDMKAAAKRAGLTISQVTTLKKDPKFLEKVDAIIGDVTSALSATSLAVSKFERTQELLSEMLQSGETGVASALVKTHEMEFRKCGLFEKDNKQKAAPILMNIGFSGMDANQPKIIEGEVIDAEQE